MSIAEEYLQSPADEFHLACLLLSPTARVHLGDTLDALDPDDFYDPATGQLWAAARMIHGRGDRVTKRALLAEAPTALDPGFPPVKSPLTKAKLEQISGEPVFVDKIQPGIQRIKQTARMRSLVQALERVRAYTVTAEDYSQALGVAWEELHRLDERDLPTEVVPFATLVEDFHKAMAGEAIVGQVVPTPWPELNSLFAGGLHPSRSVIIAGRPGDGKTMGALNVAQHAAEQHFPTLVVSEEMSNLEVTGRLMAAGAQVEYGEITRQDMSDYTASAVAEYGERYRDMSLWVIDKPNLTIEYIAAIARNMKRRHGLALLVIDYLQLLAASDKTKVREQQVAHISKTIHDLARELKIAIVVAAQLNRDNAKANRKPTKADLRESGSLEQDADSVILLHHELTEDGRRGTGYVHLIVAKNRQGPEGEIELRWRGHQARIG